MCDLPPAGIGDRWNGVSPDDRGAFGRPDVVAANLLQPAHQKRALVHPLLDRAKRGFDRLAALVEDVGAPGYAGLHSVQYGLVLETRHAAELIAGTLRADRAVSAGLAIAVIDLLQAAHQRRRIGMKTLTRWAEKAVAGWVVAEFIFPEQARSDRRTTLRTRHVRVDPGLLAGLDVLDLEITPIGHDRDPFHSENLFCRFGGLCQQTHIDNLVGDLLLDDQLVLGIDGDLHIVAHRDMRMRRHRSAVGVGERDLALPRLVQFRQHVLVPFTPLANRGDLLSQVLDPRAACCVLRGVALVEALKIVLP